MLDGRFAMSTYVNHVDPPDLGMLPTFRRLLRLWGEQWKLGVFGLGCSLVYTLISIAIPILIQRAIDHSIDTTHHHHRQALWPYLAIIVGLATVRAVIAFNRRYATARIGVRIEARMREIQARNLLFERKLTPKPIGLEKYRDDWMKRELIEERAGDVFSEYTLGPNFIDFCRGPHVPSTE